MSKTKRNRYSAEFKVKVATEALRGEWTMSEPAACHGVHLNLVAQRKKQVAEGMTAIFAKDAGRHETAQKARVKELHAKIGQLMVERDFWARFGKNEPFPKTMADREEPSPVRHRPAIRPSRPMARLTYSNPSQNGCVEATDPSNAPVCGACATPHWNGFGSPFPRTISPKAAPVASRCRRGQCWRPCCGF